MLESNIVLHEQMCMLFSKKRQSVERNPIKNMRGGGGVYREIETERSITRQYRKMLWVVFAFFFKEKSGFW